MAYGNDVSVYVDDQAGQLGAQPSPAPWWLSPDVDIVGHTGEAVQGVNQVQIRVHAHEEPIIDTRIIAQVFVGKPGFVLSPITGTVRIDGSNALFRPPTVPGPEPIADETGGTLTFNWTPSASSSAIDGPGHRCLILRAFPDDVTPPDTPFDVPNEQHETQHNIEILSTTKKKMNMSKGGAGTKDDPRGQNKDDGLWWERFVTMAPAKKGKRFVIWAFDPKPSKKLVGSLGLPKRFKGFSPDPPAKVLVEAAGAKGEKLPPIGTLLGGPFGEVSGVGGKGLFAENRLVGGVSLTLAPQKLSEVVMRFDHSNLKPNTAVMLHGAQWSEDGTPEGGMTVVALAPTD